MKFQMFQITLFALLSLCAYGVHIGDESAVFRSENAASSSSVVLKDAIRESDSTATSSSVVLKASSRQNLPCESNDIPCWCMKAVEYTNDARREAGVSNMLKVGSESQLANANKWAEKLSRDQGLEHQDFDAANREIGCGRRMGGENVAYNFESGDYARACMDQWIGSQGHYENIVRDWFEEVVVGFALDSRGAVYCVQTFAVMDGGNESSSGRECEPVSSSGGMTQTAEPVPTPVTEPMRTPEPESDSKPSEPVPEPVSEPIPTPESDSSPGSDSPPDSPMVPGECDKNDIACWCMKAVEYTNDARREAGVSNMLKVGSESQLANANKWAEKLSRDQGLEHQDFDAANREIGCGRRMGGENVAYNFESGDYARACLDQWIGSQGHYENIVRDWFEEVVVGFAFDSRGAVYCVQTFAVMGGENESSSGRECEPVSSSGGMAQTAELPKPVTEPMRTPEPESDSKPIEPKSDEQDSRRRREWWYSPEWWHRRRRTRHRRRGTRHSDSSPGSDSPPESDSGPGSDSPPESDSSPGSDSPPDSPMVPGECDKNDIACWCMKAVEYTNDARREAGVSNMLKVGSESQLANANKWAEKLSRDQGLEHQDFDAANREIGCGRRMGGENVAYNSESGDYARACLDQWIGSQGHYENIVRDGFEEVVVGFAFDSRGAVYCVQTFAIADDSNGDSDGRECEAVSPNMEGKGAPEPVSEPVSEPTPVSVPTPEPVSVPTPEPVSVPTPKPDPVRTPKPDPVAEPNPTNPGDCEKNDTRCWCMKAVKYTNDVRRQNGVSSMLKVGSESQLANANKWAEKLSRDQGLEHQDFDTANGEIGCGRALGGENVAYNFESGDYARACVDQWISSQGHFENMVRDWFLEVVVGFAFDSRGAVYCVQTFAVTDDGNGSPDGNKCSPVQM